MTSAVPGVFQKPARCFVANRKLLPTFQVLTNLRSHATVITEIKQ